MAKKIEKSKDGYVYYHNNKTLANFITAFRVPITIVAVIALFSEYNRFLVALIFGVAAFTDFLDGQVARRLNRVTKFGERFDLISDRIFVAVAFFSFLIYSFGSSEFVLLLMCVSREVVGLPGYAIRLVRKKDYYSVNKIGKAQTFLQAVALVFLIWGLSFAVWAVLIAFIWGFVSGANYLIESFH